jgi:hypothetical protein
VTLKEIAENTEDTAEARRKQQKLTKRLETAFSVVNEEKVTLS